MWDNKRGEPDRILERLDRFLANEEWKTAFPNHCSKNLDFFNSGHKWLLEDDYRDSVKHMWNSIPKGTDLNCHLKRIFDKLNSWAKERVGTLAKDIKNTKNSLNKWLEAEKSPHCTNEIK